MENNCMFCNSPNVEKTPDYQDNTVMVICPVCGRYIITLDFATKNKIPKDIVGFYLYHNNKLKQHSHNPLCSCFLGSKEEYDRLKESFSDPYYTSSNEIKAFFPRSFSERIDKTLLAFSQRSRFFGDEIKLTKEETNSLFFIKQYDQDGTPYDDNTISAQRQKTIKYFKDAELIRSYDGTGFESILGLQGNGWKRVDEIERHDLDNRDVFISMSFAEETKPIREAIREGITNADFSAEFLDEIIHNRQIVPEMFRLIRESRFLIMDISQPNYGAYYEAGYALGLGKEVIITCSEETFYKEYKTDEEKKYAKYLKPHFDILQKQILLWKDYEDLTLKLSEWIKALIY